MLRLLAGCLPAGSLTRWLTLSLTDTLINRLTHWRRLAERLEAVGGKLTHSRVTSSEILIGEVSKFRRCLFFSSVVRL